MQKTVGLIGARGYVGSELLGLVAQHRHLEIAYASSRSLAGQSIEGSDAVFETLLPGEIRERDADIVILALPNGLAHEYVAALEGTDAILVDVSADYRFDDAWTYGLPELYEVAPGTRLISNPGCYATAMQVAVAPVVDLLDGPAVCFGVSGYSGAGTTPSDKNDPERLKDNVLPYAGVGHLHEREVSRHLDHPVEFMPHVAEFFRGISMTVDMRLKVPQTPGAMAEHYAAAYAGKPLVRVTDAIPLVADNAGRHHAAVGGFTMSDDGRRLVAYSTLDNLLKGAATQAIQNLNLACGFAELEGINDDELSLAGQDH